MKSLRRVLAFALVLVMLSCSTVCAAGSISIISPTANAVVTGDSLLISVKLTEKKNVKVAVYEELESVKVSGREETTLAAVNCAAFKEEDFKKLSVKYVSGAAVVSSVTASVAVDGTEKESVKTFKEKTILAPTEYQPTAEISFFTKKLSDVKPGLYRVVVEIPADTEGGEPQILSSFAAVKAKEETKAPVLEVQQSGAIKIIQNVLKSIFK